MRADRFGKSRFLSWLVMFFAVALLGACGGGGSSSSSPAPVTPQEVSLETIVITPQTATMAAGTSKQFAAEATYSDGSQADVTEDVTWSVDDGAVMSIENAADGAGASAGKVTGLTPGKSFISASLDGVTASTPADSIEVTDAVLESLQVEPFDPSVALGRSQQFTVTGTYSDGSNQDLSTTVSWSSSATTIADIDGSGLATTLGKNAGSTQITASLDGQSDTTTLTVTDAELVSIEVTPGTANVPAGRTQQFSATGTYSDGTNQSLDSTVSWSSADESLVTISDTGLATGLSEGGPVAIVASQGGKTGEAELTVSSAVVEGFSITPQTKSLAKGLEQQFVAQADYSDGSSLNVTESTTWTSVDPNIVSIDSQGLATAMAEGSDVTIDAEFEGFMDAASVTVTAAELQSVEVTPANSSLADGTTKNYFATAVYTDSTSEDVTNNATWTSSDRAIAEVSNSAGNKGVVLARDPGQVEISASFGGQSGKTGLTVTAAVLNAIQVSPAQKDLPEGYGQQLSATGFYSDGSNQDVTDQVSWSSANPTVVSVSNAMGSVGFASAIEDSPAPVSITASLDGVSGNAAITATAEILTGITVVSDNNAVPFDPDVTEQFTAQGNFSGGSTVDLTERATWISSDESIATISNIEGSKGLLSQHMQGSVIIEAVENGERDTKAFEITAAALETITITPADETVAAGRSVNYTATGTYSDDSTQDITSEVTWSSSVPAEVSISNAAGEEGKATTTAAAAGNEYSISAAKDGINSNSAILRVTAAVLESITVETVPAGTTSTPAGTSVQYSAEGLYSDGSIDDISNEVSWSVVNETPVSDGDNVGDISNADGSKGQLSTFFEGTLTARASLNGVDGDAAQLTVNAALLQSVTITPIDPAIALNTQQQFTATANYGNGTSADVSTQAAWTSSDETVASVQNGANGGLATSVGTAGQSIIEATFNGESGSSLLTVNPASLVRIDITPSDGEVPEGYSVQLQAIGHYSDGSSQSITSEVTWGSFQGFVTMSNASGTEGQATGSSQGMDTISAIKDDVTGTTSLTVSAAVLTTITVTPDGTEIDPGATLQMQAEGTFDDGSRLIITDRVSWSSSDTTVATVSNADGSRGLVTGEENPLRFAQETATIQAEDTATSVSGSASVVVNP